MTIMTDGKKDAVDQCKPYFEAMGKHVFYFGNKAGSAQVAKLSNNLMLAINMVGCTEGLKFAKSFDLPPERLLELVKVSTGDSWVVQNWDVVSKWWEDYEPNRTLDLVYKDLFALLNVCFKTKLSLSMGGLAFNHLLNAWGKSRHIR